MGQDEVGQEGEPSRLIPAGQLARALRVPSSVLSYYEAKLKGVRAVADGGGRAYRRADAMVLATIALEVADGASLADCLESVASAGRDAVGQRGRRFVETAFPAPEGPRAAPRAVPQDAIVRTRGAAPEPSAPIPLSDPQTILRTLAQCVHELQRARR